MKQSVGITFAVFALAASATGLATSQTMMATPAPGMMATMPTEADFVRAVQQSNDQEIAAARFILRSTKNPAIIAFVTQMIDDHSTSDVSLQTASRNAHVPIPQRMRPAMAPPMLQGMMGPGLDAAYIQQQVDAHSMALTVLTTEVASGKNPALKAFASDQAPVVRAHLDKAENILSALPTMPHAMSSVAPLAPGGVRPPGSGQGSLIGPSTPAPIGSNSPNPQPSVGIPGTLPSPGPSSSPH